MKEIVILNSGKAYFIPESYIKENIKDKGNITDSEMDAIKVKFKGYEAKLKANERR